VHDAASRDERSGESVARRAGMTLAMNPAAASSEETPTKTTGSSGLTS